jgi:hypothetical protein
LKFKSLQSVSLQSDSVRALNDQKARGAAPSPSRARPISIPLFSQGNNTFSPAIQFVSAGISVPAFGYLLDLRYVTTLRTYLYYERSYTIIFFNSAGRRLRPTLTCHPKKSQELIAGIFPRNRGDFPPE